MLDKLFGPKCWHCGRRSKHDVYRYGTCSSCYHWIVDWIHQHNGFVVWP